MRLLLDTQILIWFLTDRQRLSRSERDALDNATELLVSAVSLFELRVKALTERRKGLSPTVPSPEAAIAFCEAQRVAIRSLTADDTAAELLVDTPHGDPFDEMIVAHAVTLQARLLTRDHKLREHPLAYRP